MTFRGIWQEGQFYESDESVVWNGTIWCAVRITSAKPGSDDSWSLMVKRG